MRPKYLSVLAGSLMLGLSMSISAAATPEFGRTAEEWAHLRDNKLEWFETDELVDEYNPIVLTNRYQFEKDEQNDMTAREVRSYLINQASDLDSMASDLEDITGMQMQSASYRLQAESLRNGSLDNTSDFRTIKLGYEKIELQLKKNVRDGLIAYYNSVSDRDRAVNRTEYLKALYESAVKRSDLGMITETERLTALENLQNAMAELVTKDAEIERCRRSLIVQCGWAHDAQPEIGELPVPDIAYVLAADPAADTQKAVENSILLRQDRIRVENAGDLTTDNVEREQRQLETDTNNASLSMRTAYDSMIAALNAYQSALTNHELSGTDYKMKELEFEKGSISRMDLLAAADSLESAGLASVKAQRALLASIVSYQYMLEGLAE